MCMCAFPRSFISIFLLRKKLPYVVTRDVCPSVRPSVVRVEISLERGSKRSVEIDLKIGLYIDN